MSNDLNNLIRQEETEEIKTVLERDNSFINQSHNRGFTLPIIPCHNGSGEDRLIDVRVMELNENPKNYFQDVEQSAFALAHIVDGVGHSPDKMLQGRLLSYPDAHRYRLGVNYEQIPVNKCPYMVANYQRDGHLRVDGNGESAPNYFPNSFDDMIVDKTYREPSVELDSNLADWYDRNASGNDDHYTKPGDLYRKAMNDDEGTAMVK